MVAVSAACGVPCARSAPGPRLFFARMTQRFLASLAAVAIAATAASQPARPTGRPLFVAVEAEAALADPGIARNVSTVLRQRLARIDDESLESARRAAGRGNAPASLR